MWSEEDVRSCPGLMQSSFSLFPHRLAALSARETRLQEVRSAFLAAYSSTVGLRAAAPSPSGAIGGLLEQFVRGVGLRGTSTSTL
jgi:myotubularin-related protein 14